MIEAAEEGADIKDSLPTSFFYTKIGNFSNQ